jgi:hypothetical protein
MTPIAAAINMPEQRDPYLGSPFKEVENNMPVECNDCRKDIM